ncbi:hypothetical protein AUJ77_02860 [Candidatus Nomurabacteria bacterium CG1_02_43_90]|uniref:Uncharacterized protein n=1 Tax=Candidatus Nomurabacteria bacterium CG1_02_43_90 TaxID=1805281 RepID=A0A1J4V3D3_9BACT|nr:MAG: hypothetical protein AUJ77_02860 [Candidatus Nomurabacteria bacterium CG1_02_43_90]
MQGFIKIVFIIAIIGIVIIGIFFVLDIVNSAEMKQVLIKVALVLGLLTVGGIGISFLSKKGKEE